MRRFSFRASPAPHFPLAVLLSLIGSGLPPLRADWSDSIQGQPALRLFSNERLGVDSVYHCAGQDDRGRLFFAADKLLVYDGAVWRGYPLPESISGGLGRLLLGANRRIWVGGDNQIGYYDETPAGDYSYTSLRPRLAPGEQNIDGVWDCAAAGSRIFFVATSKVLGWDGDRFTTWDFPTTTRLYPFSLDGESWFTHPETGMYRITPAGPKLEYPAGGLPPTTCMYAERRGQRVLVIGNEGFFYLDQPTVPVSPPAFSAFCLEGRISGVVKRPGGGYFISTIRSGLAVVTENGGVQRVLGPDAGLPSNAVVTLMLDRDNALWCSTRSGLVRLDASGSMSRFNDKTGLLPGAALGFVSEEKDLWLHADAGVYRLETRPGRTSGFSAVPGLAGGSLSVLPWNKGFLLGRFNALEEYTATGLQPVVTGLRTSFSTLLSSRQRPQGLYYLANRMLGRLDRTTDGPWTDRPLTLLPDSCNGLWEDDSGRLWCRLEAGGIARYDPGDGRLTRYQDDQPEAGPHRYSAMTGAGAMLYFASNEISYQLDVDSGERRRLGLLPGAMIEALAPSSDHRCLYVLFTRTRTGGTRRENGLGCYTLPTGNEPPRWTEFETGGLPAIGLPRILHLRAEEGRDALWIGGSEAVLRVRPDELPALLPPRQPALRTVRAEGLTTTVEGLPAFLYTGHHLRLKIETPEVGTRARLLFQSRFGTEDASWSAPTDRDEFDFKALSEGRYVLAVRSVNPAGVTSPAAEYGFRILPPWYRTNWAYGCGALGLLAGMILVQRGLVHRTRTRNKLLQQIVAGRTAELVKANAAKDEFLAGLGHEIRNQMNVVVGLSTTINPAGLDEVSRRHFSYLRHCATHLSGLLEDIIDYSKVQTGAVGLEPKPFDVADLVESIRAITAAESARLSVPVEAAISALVPPWLLGDPVRIRQILLNLVFNALKYSGGGTVLLTVWSRAAMENLATITFAVTDEGPGISAEEQQRLFTGFERGEAARQQRVAGAGLGLALSHQLAEKMGGRIWVVSEGGHGSTFYLELPLPVAVGPAPAPPTPRPVAPTRRALVVDDEEYNRVTLAALLGELGYACACAGDFSQAMAAARAEKFHAVFLDFDLPGRNGPDIARELRLLPGYPPSLPIIAATAYHTPETRERCLAAGMSGFLSKPITLEKIRSVLAGATLLQEAVPTAEPEEESPPLALLRMIAASKGVPLAEEFQRFEQEMQLDMAGLAQALRAHDPASIRAAHRLTGRFGFIGAQSLCEYTHRIEGESSAQNWPSAEDAYARLAQEWPAVCARLKAAAS